MKKLLLLTKTFLVAALLGMGVNGAWAQTTSVGTDNTTAWWSAFSDYYTLEPNQTLTISFKNYTDKSANGNNWIGVVTTDADRDASGYYEYFVLRADNYGWGGAWVYSNLSSYYNWDTFKADMDGATVAMTVSRNGSIVKLHADITKAGESTPTYWEEYWTACGSATDNIRFFLTTEKGHLTDIASSIAANGNTSESTGWGTLNAQIDFSNAISSNSVAGRKNSMALSGSSFELGYTSGDPAVTVLGDILRVGNGSGTVTIPDAELAGDRDEVIISFDYWFGSLSGKNAGFTLYDGAETPVTIASYYDNFYGGEAAENTFGLVESNITSLGSSKVGDAGICVDANKTRLELHLNYATGTMWAVQYTNGVWKQTTTPVAIPTTAGKLKSFAVRSNYNSQNNARRCWFDNLLIQTKRGDYSAADVSYTVKFVDGNGTAVKADDTSREALAGTAVSDLASPADMTTFYNDGDIANNNTEEFAGATNKYVYKSVSAVNSSSEAITELEAGAVVTIVYDKYVKYNYAVKQKLGDAAATDVATGSLWDNETYTYYFPKGVKSGDDYYFTEANGSSPYFGGTLTKDATTVTINYTLDPSVVFYSEGEDLDSKTGTYGYDAINCASGSSGVLNNADGNLITSLSAGIYTITARTIGRGDDASHKIHFYKSAVDDANKLLTCSATHAGKIETSDAFALTGDTEILIKGAQGGGANGNGLDYVIITKLPDNVSATVTAAGYATYVNSDYDLDFSATSIKAYKVKVNPAGEARLTKVEKVPAGTPMLLYKEGGATEDIPVTTGAAAVTDNDLVAGTGAAVATDGGTVEEVAYTNMILNNGSDGIGFYFANGQTVASNRAYLHIASTLAPNAASRMVMKFADDEETNGINSLTPALSEGEGAVFNLQGQRVPQPSKGLYIVNGRKVVIK